MTNLHIRLAHIVSETPNLLTFSATGHHSPLTVIDACHVPGDRGTMCANNLPPKVVTRKRNGRPGVKTVTSKLRVQRSNHYTTKLHIYARTGHNTDFFICCCLGVLVQEGRLGSALFMACSMSTPTMVSIFIFSSFLSCF